MNVPTTSRAPEVTALVAMRPRLVPFLLPQFHPTAENDKWWGRGFTEWTNVTKARPLFTGHVQPHLPADLGFYDLRLPEARIAQADLARSFGIEAFCYYHYWFHGTRLLHQPIDDVLSSGEPNFPFCFCWANEPWSRTWLGDEREVLIAQRYSREDDRVHAQWLTRAFADPRYLKTNGRPVFLIYRVSHMDAPAATIDILREASAREGLPDPYVVLCDGHQAGGDLRAMYGADMTLRYEPQLSVLPGGLRSMNRWRRLITNFTNAGMVSAKLRLYDYARSRALMRGIVSKGPSIRTVLVRWDNSPRRGARGIIMTSATPTAFGRELRGEMARDDWNSSGTGFLFLNAWTEWAEGNYLEPDMQYGHAFLKQVRDALADHERLHGRAGDCTAAVEVEVNACPM